ncbi:hypothetical protein HIM_00336 [Hirsutella minnesotensis 3608]|nr:hypothetical protein HIM_00336 [Hirsutella minnesotensis 3608]
MPPYANINLHPSSNSISSLSAKSYNVICIGSGWAGRIIAARVVKAGLTAIIVEDELVGGDCPFWACVPSKVLLRPGEVLREARASGDSIVTTTGAETLRLDPSAVFARRDTFVANWDDEKVLVPMVKEAGSDIVRGWGRLVGEKRVVVESADGQSVELVAEDAVAICTGSLPRIPQIPGLDGIDYWTPRHATSASTAPASLVILGGGAVGCEMATAYASLGSAVTLIASTGHLLARLSPKAGAVVHESLVTQGVKIMLSTTATRIWRDEARLVHVELSDGSVVKGDEILIAVGRVPQSSRLGLERFDLQGDRSRISVDESLRVLGVSGSWLYAAGDVNERHPLTHGSKYHGRIVANSILAHKKMESQSTSHQTDWSLTTATADRLALPQVIFTSPPVATVGLSHISSLDAQGLSARTIEAPAKTLASMIQRPDAAPGWAQWVVEKSTGRLLGATIVGDGAEDLIHAYTMAIVGGLTLQQLVHVVPSFPTRSEVHLNLLDAAGL